MHINLKESIYKCPSSNCMYPLADYTFKNNDTQEIFKYNREDYNIQPKTKPTIEQNMIMDFSTSDSESFKTCNLSEFDWYSPEKPKPDHNFSSQHEVKYHLEQPAITSNTESLNDTEFMENLFRELDDIKPDKSVDTKFNDTLCLSETKLNLPSLSTVEIKGSIKKTSYSDSQSKIILLKTNSPKKIQNSIKSVMDKFKNKQVLKDTIDKIQRIQQNVSNNKKLTKTKSVLPKTLNKMLKKNPLDLANQIKGLSLSNMCPVQITTLVSAKQIQTSLPKKKNNIKKKPLIKSNIKTKYLNK